MCVCVFTVHSGDCRGQKRLSCPGAGIAGGCELPNVGAENQVSSDEQHALLTAEPSLQSD